MNITSKTRLTQKTIRFADGRAGFAQQEHEIYADGEPLGIRTVTTRKSHNSKWERKFFVDGQEFDAFDFALKAAGHTEEKA